VSRRINDFRQDFVDWTYHLDAYLRAASDDDRITALENFIAAIIDYAGGPVGEYIGAITWEC